MRAPDSGGPTLSVVIPVHNEVDNIPLLWLELRDVLASDSASTDAEVIIVNDGSTDGSDKAIREITESDDRVRCITFEQRSGLSAAFQAGYRAVRGEVVVTLDADLQSDPRDIPRMVAALAEADAAVGWRQRRRDTFTKRIASRVANGIRRRVLGDPFHDSACSLRAMRRPCIAAVPPYDGMHRFVPVLLSMNGYRVVEVPVTHRPRRFGHSKFGIRNRAWRAFLDMLVVRWMRLRRLSPPPDPD